MIEVIPKDGSLYAFEKAMTALKRKVTDAGFLEELKERRYFKKPSEKAREKRRKQQRNNGGM